MIIDSLVNASRYYNVHPLFQKAFEYIQMLDLSKLEIGKYEIEREKLKAIVSSNVGMTKEESVKKFECHDHHIDIQLCISGVEQMGWKPREKCTSEKGSYNEDKDVHFFNDPPEMYFQLTNDQFAIFFPSDVHAPMIGYNEIKKLVIKVKI